MKKILVLIVVALVTFNAAQARRYPLYKKTTVSDNWKKSPESTWEGKDKVWYKLDKQARLWWSKDGKKWETSKDQTWQDKDGKWLKIHDKKLVWSMDGNTWAEVPEWSWASPNGKWYKFDKDWSLWVKG
ncbi:hypothetical protein KK062_05940 [Fulvivirgaceae bacterium PWU5]|uniref:WWE domain-containing protein n=1 Tax=Dawidia cretensis TaxID=2782350 RepID=A0AAP2DUF6_9BACT|nr:hypothetical protein [Dawidia cretensis]MBT1707750.1 hypothetical protein [Dawidia cretensis]